MIRTATLFCSNLQSWLQIAGFKSSWVAQNKKPDIISTMPGLFRTIGVFLADYQKVNLFEGEVLDGCKPGNKISLYRLDTLNEGVAICKDMDFQQFILGYSKKGPAVLYVPAWDFVQDGWLHARMAILRSMEGGFSLIKNARQGRLTCSDWRGMVIAEANSESGIQTQLLGELSVDAHPTIYARAGDWFGTVCLFASAGFFFFIFVRRNKNASLNSQGPTMK